MAELSAAEAYRILIGSRIRSQLDYRTSFWLNVATSVAVGVYGGSYAGLPSLLIMGLPGPRFLPAWLGWFAPAFAVWAWLLAWLAWRAGIRRFTGAGG